VVEDPTTVSEPVADEPVPAPAPGLFGGLFNFGAPAKASETVVETAAEEPAAPEAKKPFTLFPKAAKPVPAEEPVLVVPGVVVAPEFKPAEAVAPKKKTGLFKKAEADPPVPAEAPAAEAVVETGFFATMFKASSSSMEFISSAFTPAAVEQPPAVEPVVVEPVVKDEEIIKARCLPVSAAKKTTEAPPVTPAAEAA